MKDLSLEFKSNLQKLFVEKKFSELQFEIESLGELADLPENILYLYAISKSLNPQSKKADLILVTEFLTQIYNKNKNNLEPLFNLVVVSLKTKTYKKTLKILNQAFIENPRNEKIIDALAKFNYILANNEEAYKYYKLLFEINPNQIMSRPTFLTLLNYHSSITQKEYLEESKLFIDIIEKNLDDNFIFNKTVQQKIKIGFFSSDFKKHSVSFFLKDFVNNLDKKEFELNAFSNLDVSKNDELTKELKKSFEKWYDVFNYNDQDLIEFIRKKKINILIDLNGFTLGNRLNIFANRVAPIQILWLGYCNSISLKNMDYMISDENCIKDNEYHNYTEKIISLPKIWNSMSNPTNLPAFSELPYLRKKIFTFGSFNNFQKISSKTIEIWSKILNNTNSRLVLKNSITDNEEVKQNLREKFIFNKVKAEQIHILDFQKDRLDHLSLYNDIDLALDTFPYNGVTTTFESVLMGVPVLTLKGFNFNSRCGESINKNLKLENFIAESYDDYYSKALDFYENLEYLKNLRKVLRSNAISSPLFDNKNFALIFSKKIKKIWENFIKG